MTDTTDKQLGELLHVAVCQAVALMNKSPGVASCIDGQEARQILRNALVAYADAYMDQPVTEAERNKVALDAPTGSTKGLTP